MSESTPLNRTPHPDEEQDTAKFTPEERAKMYVGRAEYLLQQRGIDQLTGIHNRVGFEHAMEEALEGLGNSEAHSRASDIIPRNFAVLFLDLDNFKRVNENHNHLKGDEVLTQVAKVLQRSVRGADDTVARFGGDEFYILLRHIKGEDVLSAAEKILQNLSDDELLKSFGVGASIGASTSQMTHDPEKLVLFANHAEKASKQAGKGQITVYSPTA